MSSSNCCWPQPDEYAGLVNRGCCFSDTALLVWRIFAMLCSFVPLTIVLTLDPPNFVFFLTDWGLIITCLYFCGVLALGLPCRRRSAIGKERSRGQRWKIATFLLELAWSTEFVIFLCYWVGSIFFQVERTTKQKASSYVIHSVPFCLLFLEMLLNRTRFHLPHFILFHLVYVPYGVVNWLYVRLGMGQDPIYPYVTWDNWQTALAVSLGEAFAFLGFFLGYRFAEWKYRRFLEQKGARSLSEEDTDISVANPAFLSTI